MSPFDLRGPQFLVFYLILGTLVVTLLFMLRRLIDPAGAVKVDMSDPYLIAFLRGGKDELVRVATISLVHRKLLQVSDTLVSVTSPGVADGVRIPIERQLLLYFANTSEGASAFSDPGCSFAADPTVIRCKSSACCRTTRFALAACRYWAWRWPYCWVLLLSKSQFRCREGARTSDF